MPVEVQVLQDSTSPLRAAVPDDLDSFSLEVWFSLSNTTKHSEPMLLFLLSDHEGLLELAVAVDTYKIYVGAGNYTWLTGRSSFVRTSINI